MPPDAKPPQLDEASAKLLTTHLKGISSVTLRILGKEPKVEAAITGFLQSRGILVDVTHLERMIPPPLRRYSFTYSGRSAVVTCSPEAELNG